MVVYSNKTAMKLFMKYMKKPESQLHFLGSHTAYKILLDALRKLNKKLLCKHVILFYYDLHVDY